MKKTVLEHKVFSVKKLSEEDLDGIFDLREIVDEYLAMHNFMNTEKLRKMNEEEEEESKKNEQEKMEIEKENEKIKPKRSKREMDQNGNFHFSLRQQTHD